ncbi:MAG TPA: hypothetical protein VEQ85_02550 [Lacipirellulaceae bacterium]|nr:hypothetical protein [Lacipirellulaceae bacterium]
MTATGDRTLAAPTRSWAWALGVLALGLAMISGDSLWIDELATTRISDVDRFSDAIHATVTSPQSEAQMPGYVLYAWAWEKLLGGDEWRLRLSNLPWLALAAWSLAGVGASLGLRGLVVALAVQPFLWAYANELRPYCMQIGGGALSLWAMVRCVERRGAGADWAVALMGGAWIMCAASMLGALATFVIYLALAVVAIRNRWPVGRAAALVLLAGNLALLGLGGYYARTLLGDAGGAKLWSVGLANIALVFYEFLGFFGLGPGRDAIRDAARGGVGPLAALFRPYAPGLAALAASYVLVTVTQLKRIRHAGPSESSPIAAMAAAATLGAAAMLLALAAVADWPFWGRHLAPVFPFWVLLAALACRAAWTRAAGRVAVVALMAMLGASSLVQRFHSEHRHDDYRGASAVLNEALERGEKVWWVAHELDHSKLYGASFRDTAANELLVPLRNPQPKDVASAAPPAVVIISKRDIYDVHGAVDAFLRDGGYRLTEQLKAFQVWRRAAP